ncbi:ABC transporter permease subunit [Catellatospora tritici]|uniref:ABC transporter permease subunit n=1 Tax=Catellatospora tritici TaxID=2851566 RepID=UPI001C2DBC0D|nr:ABC transporter permease subunit [Catellatospora tritici]MBV1851797.1 ABC transporter permease [Catellatospora tritici]
MTPLMRKTWRDDRRALIGWTVGIAAFTLVYTSFYPQLRNAAKLKQDAMPQGMLDFLGVSDMTVGAGYLEATVFGLIGPLLLITCGTMLAARIIARPEEDGGMELLLANPLSRRAFAGQRLAAAGLAVTVIAAIPWLLLVFIVPAAGLGVPQGNLAAAGVGMIALAWLFTAVAFLVGAATGRRGQVLAVTGVLAVGTYMARALSGMIESIAWLKWASPFHYFLGGDPLRTGWHGGYLAVLVLPAIACALAGIAAFDRRDVGV